MAFAYRDKYGILHVVDDRATAEEYAGDGKQVVEVDVPNRCGYPAVVVEIFDYGNGEIYVGGNRTSGKALVEVDAALAAEVKHVLEKIGL